MVVMFDVTAPVEREHAMAKREATPAQFDWKAVLTSDEDGFRALLQTVVQEVLEAEMTEALQAEKNERTASRLGQTNSCGSLAPDLCGESAAGVQGHRSGSHVDPLSQAAAG
jgi:hypothetical protein